MGWFAFREVRPTSGNDLCKRLAAISRNANRHGLPCPIEAAGCMESE